MRPAHRRSWHSWISLALVLNLPFGLTLGTSVASLQVRLAGVAPSDLSVSEPVEGSSNNQPLEIYSSGDASSATRW